MDEMNNKKHKDNMLLILAVVCILSLTLNIVCLYRIGDLKNLLFVVEDRIFSLNNNTLNKFETSINELEAQNSILASFEQNVHSIDLENGTYSIDVSIMPKEYSASSNVWSNVVCSAAICVGEDIFELEFSDSVYSGTLKLPIVWGRENQPSATVRFSNSKTIRSEEIKLDYRYFEAFLPTLYADLTSNSIVAGGETIHLGDKIQVEIINSDYSLESLALCVDVNGERVHEQNFTKKLNDATFFGNQGRLTLCTAEKDIPIEITDDVEVYVVGECDGVFARSYILLVDGKDPDIDGETGPYTYTLRNSTFYYDADGNSLSPIYDANGNVLSQTRDDFNSLVIKASSTDLLYGR